MLQGYALHAACHMSCVVQVSVVLNTRVCTLALVDHPEMMPFVVAERGKENVVPVRLLSRERLVCISVACVIMRAADRRRQALQTPSQRNIRLTSAAKYLSLDVHDTCMDIQVEIDVHMLNRCWLALHVPLQNITRSISFGPLSKPGL